MIRGPSFIIVDFATIQAFTVAHPSATSVLLAGVWVQCDLPFAEFAAQYEAAKGAARAVGI